MRSALPRSSTKTKQNLINFVNRYLGHKGRILSDLFAAPVLRGDEAPYATLLQLHHHSHEIDFQEAYRRLWRFLLSTDVVPPAQPLKGSTTEPKDEITRLVTRYNVAACARRLGFTSVAIDEVLQSSIHHTVAKCLLGFYAQISGCDTQAIGKSHCIVLYCICCPY